MRFGARSRSSYWARTAALATPVLAAVLALGAVAGAAGPAPAGTTFAVVDNGGVLVELGVWSSETLR